MVINMEYKNIIKAAIPFAIFVILLCAILLYDPTSDDLPKNDENNDVGNSENGESEYSIGLEYEVDAENGTCKVIGSGTCTDTEIKIPEYHGEYKVTGIGGKAFAQNKSITAVEIPKTVSFIEFDAFSACTSLKAVYITDLAAWCNIDFERFPLIYAEKLYLNGELVTDLVIPEGITEIKAYTFWGCKSLRTVTVPESVTSIGEFAFNSCRDLVSINIPKSVTNIGSCAFINCSKLSEISIPSGVTQIGTDVFDGCDSLRFNQNGDGLYLGNEENPYYALMNVTDDKIHSFSFHPDTVLIAGGVFEYYSYMTEINIPEHIRYIGIKQFACCDELESVTLPKNITDIPAQMFASCQRLKSITIPIGVTSIGVGAFGDCRRLESIDIPEGVEMIDSSAFSNCKNLQTVTIPSSVKKIDAAAFMDCSQLTEIKFLGTLEQWMAIDRSNTWCTGCRANLTVICTNGTISAFQQIK